MTPKQLTERAVYLLSMVFVDISKLHDITEYKLLAKNIMGEVLLCADQDTDFEFIGVVESLHEGLEYVVFDNKEAEQIVAEIADKLAEIDNIMAYKLQEQQHN
jgi:hypothetical protein